MTRSERHELRRLNTQKRNQSIKDEFTELYDNQRLRLDDCIHQLAQKYFLEASTIERIIYSSK